MSVWNQAFRGDVLAFHVKIVWHEPSGHLGIERSPRPELERLHARERKFLAMAEAAFAVDVEALQDYVVGSLYDSRTQGYIREWAYRTESFLREYCQVDARIEIGFL
jgi:hypothetical protein